MSRFGLPLLLGAVCEGFVESRVRNVRFRNGFKGMRAPMEAPIAAHTVVRISKHRHAGITARISGGACWTLMGWPFIRQKQCSGQHFLKLREGKLCQKRVCF